MRPIIEIKSLNAKYDSHIVLHDISLTVCNRDFLDIIGPNGGDKTTLIGCILDLPKPSSGEIIFTSSHMTGNSQLTMDYLPQYNSIDRKFPITVKEVILSGLSSKRPPISRFTKEHREKASRVTVRMGPKGLEEHAIGTLSGSQLQRALLGHATISDPEVVILDEPSTYIDRRFETRLYQLLAEINKDCTIILVNHNIGTVLQQVKSITCVNEALDYHPGTGITEKWLEHSSNCSIELLGHDTLPHRISEEHHHHQEKWRNFCFCISSPYIS